MAQDDRSDDGSGNVPDYGDAIDGSTFEQILEMDDDNTREFSHEIVYSFFDQAKQAFRDLEEAVREQDLKKLSDLGHYLKGSSATLGLVKVRDHCEKIQHLGADKKENGDSPGYSKEESLRKIAAIIVELRADFLDAEKRLRAFYES